MLKILIVEDEPLLVQAYCRLIKQQIKPACLHNTDEEEKAIRQTMCKEYDLIICDGNLLVGSGMSFFNKLKEQKDKHVDRIYFVTGDMMSYAGVPRPVYQKPITPTMLHSIILEAAYAKIARETHKRCVDGCAEMAKWSCCHEMHCEEAIRWAREMWGVELEKTDNKKLPLCGPKGCIAEPYLRPLCSIHLCEKLYMADPQFYDYYMALRDMVSTLEANIIDEAI